MAHLVDKEFVERANTVLLLGILWTGLTARRRSQLSTTSSATKPSTSVRKLGEVYPLGRTHEQACP
jgi:hypothetical protein